MAGWFLLFFPDRAAKQHVEISPGKHRQRGPSRPVLAPRNLRLRLQARLSGRLKCCILLQAGGAGNSVPGLEYSVRPARDGSAIAAIPDVSGRIWTGDISKLLFGWTRRIGVPQTGIQLSRHRDPPDAVRHRRRPQTKVLSARGARPARPPCGDPCGFFKRLPKGRHWRITKS